MAINVDEYIKNAIKRSQERKYMVSNNTDQVMNVTPVTKTQETVYKPIHKKGMRGT